MACGRYQRYGMATPVLSWCRTAPLFSASTAGATPLPTCRKSQLHRVRVLRLFLLPSKAWTTSRLVVRRQVRSAVFVCDPEELR